MPASLTFQRLLRIFWRSGHYFLAVNCVEVSLFYLDKHRAISGGWRIAESTLLLTALAGGTPGAFLASRSFRHKIRKTEFMVKLRAIALAQALALVYVYYRAHWA